MTPEIAPPGYRTGPALDELVDQLGVEGAIRVTVETLGHSVEGRPIKALTVAATDRAPSSKRPHAVVIGSIHGNEVIASEVAVSLAATLVEAASERAVAVLEAADVTVVPVVNPDGRTRSLASLGRRPFAGTPRRNARGVDLNRNWPRAEGASPHWLPWAGSDRPWLPWYRGPEPLSEPETKALAQAFEARPPSTLLNLHSVGEIITYPWSSFSYPSADAEALTAMAGAFNAARQPNPPFRSKQSNAWYPIVNSSNDYVHDRYATRAATVELSLLRAGARGSIARHLRWFWWSNPYQPESYVAGVVEPCLAAILAGLTHPRPDPPGSVEG